MQLFVGHGVVLVLGFGFFGGVVDEMSRSLPRHGTGRKLAGWIEPSRYVTVLVVLGWGMVRMN